MLSSDMAGDELHYLTAQPVTWNQIHWRTSELLDVPPVLLVSEFDPLEFRKTMAQYIDGRHVNDALYRAVQAIRRDYDLEPFPYVVAFPRHGVEIPIDLRPVLDEPTQLAGIVTRPRSAQEPPFLLTQLDPKLAEAVHAARREEAIELLKAMSHNGSEIAVSDAGDREERFLHWFLDGSYRHSYRYVAADLPEIAGGRR